MDIKELISMQSNFDEKHNWSPNTDIKKEVVNAISSDIVGLVGELGEFSNIIKKLNLVYDTDRQHEANELFSNNYDDLCEETVDVFIYLMRIMSHLSFDVEEEYLRKLQKNDKRFNEFLKNE